MNLQQALKWADDNTQPEAVDRLRSRAVAKVLAATVRKYAAWIREEGERNNTCTFNVMGEVCGYCECKRKVEEGAKVLADTVREYAAEVEGLRAEICHLTDDDICTLLALKVVLREASDPWQGDELHNAGLLVVSQ